MNEFYVVFIKKRFDMYFFEFKDIVGVYDKIVLWVKVVFNFVLDERMLRVEDLRLFMLVIWIVREWYVEIFDKDLELMFYYFSEYVN